MTALAQFYTNIVAADQLVAMYTELRRNRRLGFRGRLDAANADLLWLPRSAVVASISALDAYVHAVVYDRSPHLFGQPAPPPDLLCEQLAKIIPVKNAATFRDAIPILSAPDTLAQLVAKLKDKSLRFQSFQAPEKIEEAYRLIGHDGVFERVSELWQGPNTTAQDIKHKLAGYAKRRNQIAHEGDLEVHGQSRAIRPQYAGGCRDFVSILVARLNDVVYGV
jgi:hypothetical protein